MKSSCKFEKEAACTLEELLEGEPGVEPETGPSGLWKTGSMRPRMSLIRRPLERPCRFPGWDDSGGLRVRRVHHVSCHDNFRGLDSFLDCSR